MTLGSKVLVSGMGNLITFAEERTEVFAFSAHVHPLRREPICRSLCNAYSYV